MTKLLQKAKADMEAEHEDLKRVMDTASISTSHASRVTPLLVEAVRRFEKAATTYHTLRMQEATQDAVVPL